MSGPPRLDGRTVVVTGATSGVGLETARALARLGARLLLPVRHRGRGERAVRDIRRTAPGAAIELLQTDLGSLASVRSLAEEIGRRADRLDALVNDAALVTRRPEATPEGIEMQWAVNHLAPFLLTNLLLPLLVRGAPSRIVNVASKVHHGAEFWERDLADGAPAEPYSPSRAYDRSKLANVLFTLELARRLDPASGVTANCLHPGVLGTKLLDDLLGRPRLLHFRSRRWNPPPAEGARHVVRLVADPALAGMTGRYFDESRLAEPSAAARDPELARRLWEASARQVELERTV